MDVVERIANTVLYEGYRLFPYSPNSIKNTRPSLFGVIYPENYTEIKKQGSSAYMQTECIIRGSDSSELDLTIRFLQLKEMNFLFPYSAESIDQIQNSDSNNVPLIGYVERRTQIGGLLLGELTNELIFPIEFAEESKVETLQDAAGKSIATCNSRIYTIKGSISVVVRKIGGMQDLFKTRVRIRNMTPLNEINHDLVLRQSFLSTHLILRVQNGVFISLTEVEGDIKGVIKECTNINMWPVLVRRENDAMLSSPIILYDYPEIAPESTGDFFDSTEVEEYLLLHISMLSDKEKEQFSQGDEKLHALFENAKQITPDKMLKLHGTFRFTKSTENNASTKRNERK